jgi:hypothetical protein
MDQAIATNITDFLNAVFQIQFRIMDLKTEHIQIPYTGYGELWYMQDYKLRFL